MRQLLTFSCLTAMMVATGTVASDTKDFKLTLFAATDCPIAGRAARILSMQLPSLRKSGVSIRIVFPNAAEKQSTVTKWMIEHGLSGIEASLSSDIAKQLNIRTTPTAILQRGAVVVYSGKLSERDDSARPGTHYPAAAVEALTKQKPYIRSTSVTGCPIRQTTIPSAEVHTTDKEVAIEPSPITWNGNVKRIFSRSCLPCHTGTGVGPVKLVSYSDIYGMATKIKALVATRTMPPWQAEDIGKFHDDPSLSLSELQQLDLWFKRGMPVGGKTATAQELIEIPSNKWHLGQPTLVINQSQAYVTPSTGKDHYRCFVFRNITDRDRWMNAIAFQPGAVQSVHHVSAFIDTSGAARKMDDADPGAGYTNPTPGNGPGFKDYYVIGGWTPGHKPRTLPQGSGIPIPKGADLVVEVHYHLTGKQESDVTTAGLYFTDEPVDKRYRVGDVGTYNIAIKANDPMGKADASAVINSNVSLHSITPHLHLLGRTMKVTAELPNGQYITILNIRRWDFRWQPSYRFLKPLQLPRGTRIDVVATYDNTSSNVDNPHMPPRDIVWGEGTDEEMCSVFFGYTDDDEHLHGAKQ
jgi:hypothetical protein